MRRFCHLSASALHTNTFCYTHDIEDGSEGVARVLVLRGITNEALLVSEGHPGRRNSVSCGTMVSVVAWSSDKMCAHLGR